MTLRSAIVSFVVVFALAPMRLEVIGDQAKTTVENRVPAAVATLQMGGSRNSSTLSVLVSNRRSVQMEAWEIEIVSSTESVKDRRLRIRTDHYDWAVAATPPAPGQGPIAAGETRELVVNLDPKTIYVSNVSLVMAAFEDGDIEGSADSRGELLTTREKEAEEIGAWLDLIDRTKNQDAQRIQAAIRQRLHQIGDDSRELAQVQGLRATFRQLAEVPPARFGAVLSYVEPRLRVQQRAALRHRGR